MKTPKLIRKVKKDAERFHLFDRGERVLLAVSGGPDSMALLEVMVALSKVWDLSLFVAHYDHRLREGSEQEAIFVRQEAERRGLPFILGVGQVRAYAQREKLSLEVAGRELRYRFFDRCVQQLGLDKVALAHQADDLAEEVLLRFIRGAGRRGLAGIPIKREGRYVRPLLLVSRQEIEAFLREREIPFVEDPSNRDPRFLRNRVRHLLIPFLEAHFHRNVRKSLKRTALVLAEEEEFFSHLAQEKLKEFASFEGQVLHLNVRSLKTTPLALRRRIYLEAFKLIGIPLFRINLAHVEQIERLLEGRSRGAVNLPSGFIARREPGRLVFKKEEPRLPPFEITITGPGEYSLPYGGTLCVFYHVLEQPVEEKDTLLLDPEKVCFPFKVRSPAPGDRIHPPGLGGRKKLKKLFWEKKLPHEARWIWPIIEYQGQVVAIPGFFVDESFKATKKGKKALAIKLSALPSKVQRI